MQDPAVPGFRGGDGKYDEALRSGFGPGLLPLLPLPLRILSPPRLSVAIPLLAHDGDGRCFRVEWRRAVYTALMKKLVQRIREEGRNLGGGVLKVDSFVNHQVDPILMDACGREFAARFEQLRPTKVLTAEISGIAPAVSTGLHLGIPVVYARKKRPITMPDQVLLTLSQSHTKGGTVELVVSPEYLRAGERVLIIDDFLASGQTILGLVRLTRAGGAELVGIGALIEKSFEGGRAALEHLGVQIESLACIRAMDGETIDLEEV